MSSIRVEDLGSPRVWIAAARTCAAKARFPTRPAAKQYAAKVMKKYGGRRQRPYRCDVCQCYHLATIPAPVDCPECAGSLDSHGTCPACGWAPERDSKKSAGALRGERSQ